MKNYIGIDLGTTNSAICSYDGENIRIWKSPEQNDVTPSAIYIDKRGNKFYGNKAYNQAQYNPNNSATLFKRFMGTSTKIVFEAANISMTPEECSAEILKVLYGYLPEEIRNDPETATVITVPAAFNQMKKDATLRAAKLAGIGNVALMQEPVAAIMSIMQKNKAEGIFLVYDLGGGTFDVSIAENIRGKVTLLAHGGIEMCGGRDIDRTIFNQIVLPWLKNNFDLPDDFLVNKKYRTFCRVAQWATEKAKIELSASDTSTIALSEDEARIRDESQEDVFIDISLSRTQVDELMADLINETILATRETMSKAGITSNDIEKIVFVGGPTNYKPLRDKVSFELSLPANIDVNPMTAVAEGASIFAESIDWSTHTHNRKATNDVINTKMDLSFKYTSRVSGDFARISCITNEPVTGYTISFTSNDTGWTTGDAELKTGAIVMLPLAKNGENKFTIIVKDEFGKPIDIGTSNIVISKTIATIAAIPASHSIGVEVMDRLGGTATLDFIVNEGDPLPKKGSITFKSAQTLKSNSSDSINIKLWEGSILSPISDNRFIGVMKIKGSDLENEIIPIGADIECEYEVSDSGTITMEVSIPSIGATFSDHNFYSRQEGQIDLSDVENIASQAKQTLDRINKINELVDDDSLNIIKEKIEKITDIDSKAECDPEDIQKANNDLLEAKKILNKAKQNNLKEIRQMDLDAAIKDYNEIARKTASDVEQKVFDNLATSAQKSIDRNDTDFDNLLDDIRSKIFIQLFNQDWFVIYLFQDMVKSAANYTNLMKFNELKMIGEKAIENDDMRTVRSVVIELNSISKVSDFGEAMFDFANIVRG